MRKLAATLGLAGLLWGAGAGAEDRPDALAMFDFLVGGCWTASFPDGKLSNTHCFTRVEDGAAVRDTHVVIGAAAPYAGETLYRWNPERRAVTYVYRASDGGESRGAAIATAQGIDFPDERYVGADGGTLTLRGTLIREGGGYVSVSEQRDGDAWKPMWRMTFARSGAAPDARAVVAGPMTIGRAILRAAPAGSDIAGYAAFDNQGGADRLVSARCDCAGAVEFHRVTRSASGADMANDWPLALPAGARTEVRPGGDVHFMLMRTAAPIAAGDVVPMILVFEKAGAITVPFRAVADSAAGWTEP